VKRLAAAAGLLLALAAALCGAARADSPTGNGATGNEATASKTAGATTAGATTAEGIALLAGKQVPLPPGRWEVLGRGPAAAGADGLASLLLGRIEDGRVAGLVLAFATSKPRKSILGPSPECSRSDIYLAYTAYDTAYDGLCGFLKPVLLSPAVAGPPSWVAAQKALAARGIGLPVTWLTVGIRARSQAEALEVRYYFPPPDGAAAAHPADGSANPWAANPWSPANVTADPARQAAITRLAVWGAWVRGDVEAGLRGRLDPAELPPWPWGGDDLAARLVDLRLRQLDGLAAAGAVDAAAYEAQRRELEAVVAAPERAETPVWLHALWKTLTYRALSMTDSFIVAYFVLGDAVQSLAWTAFAAVRGPVIVYLHELGWTYSGYGKAAPALLDAGFAEIGMDR
jgi:uncharacterized membrane protein